MSSLATDRRKILKHRLVQKSREHLLLLLLLSSKLSHDSKRPGEGRKSRQQAINVELKLVNSLSCCVCVVGSNPRAREIAKESSSSFFFYVYSSSSSSSYTLVWRSSTVIFIGQSGSHPVISYVSGTVSRFWTITATLAYTRTLIIYVYNIELTIINACSSFSCRPFSPLQL